MTEADRRRWDQRYATIEAARPAPPDVLVDRAELVPSSGRALDVACGAGATSVWLARRGLLVDAVDISPPGLTAGAELARRCGVAERLRWWPRDLDLGLPPDCAGPYDIVVCQRFRDPGSYPALVERLRPGGLLAITVLSSVGGPAGPFRARPGELSAAFAELEVLVQHEGDGVAGLLARRHFT